MKNQHIEIDVMMQQVGVKPISFPRTVMLEQMDEPDRSPDDDEAAKADGFGEKDEAPL